MINANEARALNEADIQTQLNAYVDRVYGNAIQKAAERRNTYIEVDERRPYDAVEKIANYLKECGYRVAIKEVAKPVWRIEVYW